MHLESTSSSNNNCGIRSEPADTTLDVTEFLHAHVSAEATFSQNVTNAI